MNFKTTYILFGSLLLLLAIAGFMLTTGPRPGDEGLLLQGPRSFKLAAKDFDSFTIDRKSPQPETITFQRGADQKWKLVKPIEARADSAAVDRAIDDLLSARREGKGEVAKNLGELGLEPASLTLTIGRPGGEKYTVSFGKTTLGASGEVFAVAGDNPKTPLPIARANLSSFLKESKDPSTAGDIVKNAADFRSRDLLLDGAGFNPAERVQSVKLSDGKSTIALSKKDNSWKFDEPANLGTADTRGEPGENPDATPSGVEQLIKVISAIKPANVSDITDAPADFATFGLEPGKEVGLRVEVGRKPTTGDTPIIETLLVGKKDDKTGQVFVRVQGERAVAKVDGKLFDPLAKALARPVNLRERQLLAFNPTDADALDIKLAGSEHALELRRVSEPPAWKLFAANGTSQLANTLAIRDLLTALGGKAVKDFPDPSANDAALGFDKPVAEVTLWVHGIIAEERKEEKKEPEKDKAAKPDDRAAKPDDKAKADEKAAKPEEKPAPPSAPKLKEPNARLIFGKRDKDLLFVRRITKGADGKESKLDFAVSESLLAKVTRGPIEYVDPTLPSFATGSVQKLTFNRGTEVFTIEKQESLQWIIRQPEDRAGRTADLGNVEMILGELASLRALRLWTEKPSERELERYGLHPARIKAVVTTKEGDKTEELTYSFGNETDDKSGIYARQSGRDLVFVIRRELITGLESLELLDPLVFRIDPMRVTGIKLTGWKDVVGQQAIRDLERKGPSNWVMRSDAAAKVNAPACESLLKAITTVRAEKFVVHKSGPRPEQKLAVAAGALEIAITMEGEKDPVTLTIGGADADGKNFFAMSSKVPGDVFLLPKGIFEAIKAKPGYFSAE